jgi:hypothetical protein
VEYKNFGKIEMFKRPFCVSPDIFYRNSENFKYSTYII